MNSRKRKLKKTAEESATTPQGPLSGHTTECMYCGADITHNTHPNARPDFCDSRCEDAYYGEEE
jgi:hypothetical protein